MAGVLPCAGERVRLRALRTSDLAAFQAYRGDPAVGLYQGWTPMNDDDATAFLATASTPFCPPGAWCQVAIADAGTDALIGDIGLHLSSDGRTLDIGYTLARAAQGAGRATEAVRLAIALAFAHTPAQWVQASADVLNVPSVRLLQRLGFRHTATRDAVFRGQPCRDHDFVLVRPALESRA